MTPEISKAQQDLEFIRQIMDESRTFATISGNHFIVWGFAMGLGTLGMWLFTQQYLVVAPWVVWAVCVGVGWAATLWLRQRQQRTALQLHPSAVLVGQIWMSLGFTMTLMFFIGAGSGVLRGAAIPGIAAAIQGAGFFLNGSIARINWLRNLGFVWWAAACVLLMWSGSFVYLLFTALMWSLYVIPGILLNRLARSAA